jgi:hypothetical protein
MRTPLSLGYNPERLDRELRFPMPPAPRLAMANERWRVEHGAQFIAGMEKYQNTDSFKFIPYPAKIEERTRQMSSDT